MLDLYYSNMSKSPRNRKVLRDTDGNKYTIKEDNLHTVASNQIYKSAENPDVFIKVLKHDYFPDLEEESAYIRQKIENELGTAKTLSDNFFPVPHVYHASVDVGSEFIVGYIVMDKIDGRIISSLEEFDAYFDKVFAVLSDLLEFGVVYNDMNINNFIISREDDEVYVIDFEDTMRAENAVELGSRIIMQKTDGTLALNKEYIRSHLKESVKTRMEYRIDDFAVARSPRKKAKSSSSTNSSKSTGSTNSSKSTGSTNSSKSTPRKSTRKTKRKKRAKKSRSRSPPK